MKPQSKKLYQFKSKVWLYPGMDAWHFLTLPQKESAEIKKNFSQVKRGFGSLKVEAKIGKTAWLTSIFPDSRAGAYLLPLKASVRKKEHLLADDTVRFTIKIKG